MMPTQASIRVLCVDDHRIVREGIALIIAREPDLEVVGLAATGEDAIQIFRRERPDITLMDLMSSGGDMMQPMEPASCTAFQMACPGGPMPPAPMP